MIVGVASKHIEEKETHHSCDACNKSNGISFSVEVTYFHIFFIPAFIADKDVYSFCNFCNTQYKYFQMPEHFKFDAKEFKRRTKAPIWYYSMAFVVLLAPFLILWSMPSEEDLKQKRLAQTHYLKHPKLEDVYTVQQENMMYTLLKVNDITDDSVKVIQNNYEAEYEHSLEDYNDGLGFFKGYEFAIYRPDLVELFKEHTITNVERNTKE